MFDMPRCREWTPLATQQLRLRNLIQIVGYNIRPPERYSPPASCRFYYTLHETTTSAPLYTSESITSRHPKWREIRADVTQRKASTNVIIRIWCRYKEMSRTSSDASTLQDTEDLLIETWGVYFSGLRLIGANPALDFTADSFKTNTLVFQMHGGYFCSYKSLNLEAIPVENLYEYAVSSDSSNSSHTIAIKDANYLQNHRIIKEARSISPAKSHSISPNERNFKKTKSLSIKRDNNEKQSKSLEEVKVFTTSDTDCDLSKNSSKAELFNSDVDVSETAENYELKQNCVPKYRYFNLKFLKSEIRPSYNATKLQELHLLQYSIKKTKDSVKEIKRKIYKKTPIQKEASTDTELVVPRMKKSPLNLFDEENLEESVILIEEEKIVQANPSRLLKLNDLLDIKTHPSPSQRLEYARLSRRLEILRFKRRILADEREVKLARVAKLRERYNKLFEENQDIGSELMTGYHALSRRTERLKTIHQSTSALRELVSRAQHSLNKRRTELPCELAQLFKIDCDEENKWYICDVPLPILDDDTPRRASRPADCVAAGFAAHCTQVAASLIAQPLRYQVHIKGSESVIYDELTPELTDPRIPLYPRGGDTMLFRYGVFLLNKNIAQLMWGRGAAVCDIRPTLANLKRLLTSSELASSETNYDGAGCVHSQSLRSLVASERGLTRQFNRFKDGVDGHSPTSEYGLKKHRQTRSVGSCRDDRDIRKANLSNVSIMGSEPFLNEANSSEQLASKRALLKTHNSDSQLSKIGTEVRFIVGDEVIEPKNVMLVKISSNNGDHDSKPYKIGPKNDNLECKNITNLDANDTKNTIENSCNSEKSYVSIENTDQNAGCIDKNNIANSENCDINADANTSNDNKTIVNVTEIKESIEKLSIKDSIDNSKNDNVIGKEISEELPQIVEKVMAAQNADAVKGKDCNCHVKAEYSNDASASNPC